MCCSTTKTGVNVGFPGVMFPLISSVFNQLFILKFTTTQKIIHTTFGKLIVFPLVVNFFCKFVVTSSNEGWDSQQIKIGTSFNESGTNIWYIQFNQEVCILSSSALLLFYLDLKIYLKVFFQGGMIMQQLTYASLVDYLGST